MIRFGYKLICVSLLAAACFISTHAGAESLRFAVIADTRFNALDRALEFIASENAEFVIVPGDFYYDGEKRYLGAFNKYGYAVNFSDDVNARGVFFALGNHDAPPDGDPVFRSHIAPLCPANGPASSPEGTIFSVDRGDCHFVITNQYWNYPQGGYTDAQLEWLKQDLAASGQPYKFVVGHEPAFPIKRHVGDSLDLDPDMRDDFWGILAENHVVAYFCGHSHHLSQISKNGVYQIDAGEVRGDHLSVTIVDVNAESVVIRSYKTSGRMPVSETVSPENNDLVFETVIFSGESFSGDNGMEYLYGAAPAGEGGGSDEWIGGCFIKRVMSSTH